MDFMRSLRQRFGSVGDIAIFDLYSMTSNLLLSSCLSSFSVQLHVQLLTDLIFDGRLSESMLAASVESSAIAYSAVKALIRANVTLTGTGWLPNLRLGPLPFPDDCFSHSTSDSRSSCEALVCLNNKSCL